MASYREIVQSHFEQADSFKELSNLEIDFSKYVPLKNWGGESLGGFENDSATHGSVVMSKMLEFTSNELLSLSDILGSRVHNAKRWINWATRTPAANAKLLVNSKDSPIVSEDGLVVSESCSDSIIVDLLRANLNNIEIKCHPYGCMQNFAISDRVATRLEYAPSEMKAKVRTYDPIVAHNAADKFYKYWNHPKTQPVRLVS